jgi:rubrerythrin
MGGSNVTSNLFYDLVSIQYHALKGQELYQRFAKDAQGQQEIAQFFEEIRQQDIQRAERCHQLLQQVQSGTGGQGGGTAEPYPTDGQTAGTKQGQMAGSTTSGGQTGA